HAEHGHDHDHRHELHQDVSGSTPGNLRRRLKMHLTARWFGRRHSWCPLELERAHRKSPLQHYGTADTMHSRTHGSERHHIREPATVADHDRTTPEVRTPEHRMAETVDTERTPNRERRTARDSHPRVRRRGDPVK